VREEAECSKPVVDGDDHDAVRRQPGGIIVAGTLFREAAPVDPHQNR
jgi:hypothetical protein